MSLTPSVEDTPVTPTPVPSPTPTPPNPPASYVPDPVHPVNVADLFAQDDDAQFFLVQAQTFVGLDDSLRGQLVAAINADILARYDAIAAAIAADSSAKGTPIPEVVTRTIFDNTGVATGASALYSVNLAGATGSKLVPIVPVADQLILLPVTPPVVPPVGPPATPPDVPPTGP